jgi:hypothetical protein
MAYTQINVTKLGAAARYDGQGTAGVAGGDGTGLSFSNDGRTALQLENSGAGTPSVVIKTAGTAGGLAIADVTITMVANQDQEYGAMDPDIFNTSSGLVEMYFTGGNETDVLVRAIKI